jgi:hypothetical protein
MDFRLLACSLKRDAIFFVESLWYDADRQDHGLFLSLIADANEWAFKILKTLSAMVSSHMSTSFVADS